MTGRAGSWGSIRIADPSDLECLLECGGRTEYWREAGFPSADEHKKLVNRAVISRSENVQGHGAWVWVFESVDGIPIGMGYFARTDSTSGDGLAGLWEDQARSSRIAAVVICNLLDLILHDLDFDRIGACVRPDNRRAVKFWMGLGFRVEGVRSDTLAPEGAPGVVLNIGLLKRDFVQSPLVSALLGQKSRPSEHSEQSPR